MSNKTDARALYLADIIDNDPASYAHRYAAVACLRRQHAEIERLSDVLSKLNKHCDHLGIRLGEVMRERDALRDFAMYYARCPCCQREDKCVDDCTFASDAPNAAEEMDVARAAIALVEKGGGNG